MSPMQRCFSDLVYQPLVTFYVIDAYLDLFGHFARLDPGVPAHDALRLMMDKYLRRQKGNGQLEETAGSPSQRLARQVQEDSNALLLYLRCGDLRSPGVIEGRNGSLELRDDDDDDDDDECKCKK